MPAAPLSTAPRSPSRRRIVVAVALALVLLGLLAGRGGAAASATTRPADLPPSVDRVPGEHVPPVWAPVADPFRPPAHAYGPGNRGIEYATTPGQAVVASAPGTVVFAGPVAGALHVTVLHADGLRTSYSYLASVAVRTGDLLDRRAVVGLAGARLHFGVRAGSTYLDPAALFAGEAAGAVHLVPHLPGELGGASRSEEAEALRSVAGDAGTPARVVARPALLRAVGALGRWLQARERCTERHVPAPPPAGRRVVVLVGGLGSSSGVAGVADVDTASLGYRSGDVVRFSYRGGRVPGTGGSFPSLPASDYSPADTGTDLLVTADRLADLLEVLAASAPGVPLDVVAHSQGGVVARLAVSELAQRGTLPTHLGMVATVATPHGGATLASTVHALGSSPVGRELLEEAAALGALPVDPTAPAVAQLAEQSELMAALRGAGVVPGVHVRSIAARGDLVVPLERTLVAGAEHATVSLGGPAAHDALPGHPDTTRELALALGDRPPSCRSAVASVRDLVEGELVAWAQHRLEGAATATAPDGG